MPLGGDTFTFSYPVLEEPTAHPVFSMLERRNTDRKPRSELSIHGQLFVFANNHCSFFLRSNLGTVIGRYFLRLASFEFVWKAVWCPSTGCLTKDGKKTWEILDTQKR